MTTLGRRLALLWALIRFPHTLFALPFALIGAFLAAPTLGLRWPGGWTLGWILAAMVGARSAAMAVNRLADLDFDRRNPRTRDWELPAGRLAPRFVWTFAVASAGLFVLAAGMLNRLCLELAPVALLIILGYSWTKRWTALSHFVLGLSLGLAPVGAWLAVTGSFWDGAGRLAWTPLLLGLAVVLWVAGFDIIYACQDYAFDLREPRLKSIPKRLGLAAALYLSALLHGLFLTLLVALPLVAPVALGGVYWAGLGLTAAALLVEHLLVRPDDLSRANAAFFTANGLVSLVLMAAVLVEVLRAK